MEGVKIRQNLVLILVLIMISTSLIKQTSASYGKCVGKCALHCVFNPHPLVCGADCIYNCIGQSQVISTNHVVDGLIKPTNHVLHCHYDCAITRCNPLIARRASGKKVEKCVDECGLCAKN
ncbi:hypothetical protein RND81_14G170800 [Saponaria officinalis]|uniref:Thionin-like protein n=1 Tax=Saponaria officinalis TaxID=3572 RepID=A0AAW1GRS0_SAPOF